MKKIIPLSEPVICGNEWTYIKECLDTGWVSSVGSYVDRFEKEVATRVGTRYAVATVNGTSALHIALLLSGVQPDDEVLVSTLTFIAPANAIRYVGAWPIFIDAEPLYYQMDPQKTSDFLYKQCSWSHGKLTNKTTGRRIAALLPVDILGHPVDMDPLREIAQKFNLPVIEDATEGLGALYKNRPVGSLGDIGCFSFNGNKIITTGGGGMIVTDNEAWACRAKYLTTQAKDDPVEFIHQETGYNYRLTNVLAAMGCAQLEKLNEYVTAKRHIAQIYNDTLRDIPGLQTMPEASWARSTFWMYTLLVNEKEFGVDNRTLLKRFAEEQIQTRPLWQPLHRSAAFREVGSFDSPVADYLNRSALSLPCSVNLGVEERERVLMVLRHSSKSR